MAFALHVDIIDAEDHTIKVTHTFWGLTEKEVQSYYESHQKACEYFAAAVKEGRTEEELEEISEEDLPEPGDSEEAEEED